MNCLGGASFEVTQPDSLPCAAIREAVAAGGVARIRGLFDRASIRSVLSNIRDRFDARQDQRHDPRDTDAARRNFQKLQIGANSGVGSRRTLEESCNSPCAR